MSATNILSFPTSTEMAAQCVCCGRVGSDGEMDLCLVCGQQTCGELERNDCAKRCGCSLFIRVRVKLWHWFWTAIEAAQNFRGGPIDSNDKCS